MSTPDPAEDAIRNWLIQARGRKWEPCREVRAELDDAFQFTDDGGGSHNYVTREWAEGLLFAEYVHGTADGLAQAGPDTDGAGWAKIKRRQAREADSFAGVASGIGEHGIANALYRLVGILRRQAEDLEKNGGKS